MLGYVHGGQPTVILREFQRGEKDRSVQVQLAVRETVRRRVARLGQEGVEASTRVAELRSDRATDGQQIGTTWPATA